MKKITTILLPCIAAFLLGSCQQDGGLDTTGRGYIQLRLSTDDVVQTRALQDVDDPSSWYAVVSNGTETLYDDQIGAGLNGRTFDPGTYSVSVRSHDDIDAANASNSGWGAPYHTGEARDIEVSAGGTAYVHVGCGRALNAKFRLDYSEFSGIIDAFSITMPKNITFAYADGTLAREAFFAPNTSITYTITYTLGGETKTTDVQTLTLGGPATVSILKIKSDIHGTVSLSLTCDNEYEGDADADVDIDGTSGK